jgi:hypothetical protein
MSETFGSGFGFGSYTSEEPKEVPHTQEMREEPAAEDTQEFTLEIPAPEPEKVAEAPAPKRAPAPKYELTQRPLRAKKRG